MGAGRYLLILSVLLVGGCTGGAAYSLSGTFTEDATQVQVEEFRETASRYGGETVVMESFPLQFTVSGMTEQSCRDFRETASGYGYVGEVGDCLPSEPSRSPGETVSYP